MTRHSLPTTIRVLPIRRRSTVFGIVVAGYASREATHFLRRPEQDNP